jgi:hypothetical protein
MVFEVVFEVLHATMHVNAGMHEHANTNEAAAAAAAKIGKPMTLNRHPWMKQQMLVLLRK